jgi:SAM-dependent methyltransferase
MDMVPLSAGTRSNVRPLDAVALLGSLDPHKLESSLRRSGEAGSAGGRRTRLGSESSGPVIILGAVSYLMADRPAELERLQLQSRVWEPAGERLLARIGDGPHLRVIDVGCGALGWLRVLSRWVGPTGRVVGTDIQPSMLEAARGFVANETLDNVELIEDDLFSTGLEPASFDLVHARFQLAPLGRHEEQMAAYRKMVKPGGLLVLEDPDMSSWRFNPDAPAAQRLIDLIDRAFLAGGGDFNSGRRLRELLGDGAELAAEIVALPPGHAYLRLPLQFAASLEPKLLDLLERDELVRLRAEAEREIAASGRWGTTFTLIQAWRRS